MKYALVACTVGIVTLLAVYQHVRSRESLALLEESTRALHVTARVIVGGTEYQVTRGEVETPIPENRTRRKVLSTALKLEMVSNNPMYDITGTDPKRLSDNTEALSAVQEELAQIQKTRKEERLVRHLFPLQFLSALADTEKARQDFLSIRSPEAAERYDTELRRTIEVGRVDAMRIQKAFHAATEHAPTKRFSGVSGVLDMGEEFIWDELLRRFDHAQKEFNARKLCTEGHTPCTHTWFRAPSADPLGRAISTVPLPIAQEVASLFAESRRQSGERVTVEMYESVCVGTLPGPYYLSLSPDDRTDLIRFLNDYLLIRTHRPGEMLQYLREEVGLTYTPINPFAFYVCPDSGKDVSDAYSILLPEAISDTEIQRMRHNHGGFLDRVVLQAATMLHADVALKKRGVPFGLSAEELFLSHSAPFTFFQTYNPSFGEQIRTPRYAARIPDHIAQYSTIRSEYERILTDIQTYLALKRSIE